MGSCFSAAPDAFTPYSPADARSTRTTTGPVKPSVRSASRSDSAARLRSDQGRRQDDRANAEETVSASRASSITLRLPIADAPEVVLSCRAEFVVSEIVSRD